MSNLPRKPRPPYCGGNQSAEQDDSWVRPLRMIYRVEVELRDVYGSRFFYLRAHNFHNAGAIQRALESAAVCVTIEPAVEEYLTARGIPHDPLCEVRARQNFASHVTHIHRKGVK